MNDLIVTLALIAAAIGLAMALVAWRIRRIQYPPELRWPSARERARRQRRQAGTGRNDRGASPPPG